MGLIWLALGFTLLVLGGEGVVRGAASLARKLAIPPLIIGLTVVAFGTSSPELGVSVVAGLQGNDEIAIANVVGSNIFNVLMAIGIPAAIAPIRTSMTLLSRELPILFSVTAVATALAIVGHQLNRPEAAVLLIGLFAFITYSYWAARSEPERIHDEYDEGIGKEAATLTSFAYLALGVALLIGGSQLVVRGATQIASGLGISQTIIGLTIVAMGTSLPELMTSTMAAVKGEGDLAIGNALGSNIFNLLGILGVAGLVHPLQVARELAWFDLPWMVMATLLLFPLVITNKKISRTEGLIMVALYAIYTTWLVVRALG
ncbi:MAG: calcium/sodium antiporter [Synechococcus sp.]